MLRSRLNSQIGFVCESWDADQMLMISLILVKPRLKNTNKTLIYVLPNKYFQLFPQT